VKLIPHNRSRAAAFFLSFLAFLLYAPSFSGSWLMDDLSVIVNNPDIRSIHNFLLDTFPGRPLREVSYLVDYSMFGLEPWGYHVQNVFWHALNSWLVYVLAVRLKARQTTAWLAALLFLVHPVHVEVVANSSHRKDSLALAFMLLAFLVYINVYREQPLLKKCGWLAGAVILWGIAFLAKGNSLVLPFIVLAYEYVVVSEQHRFLIRSRYIVPTMVVATVPGIMAWYWYIASLPSFRMAIMGAFIKSENLLDFSVSAYVLMVAKSLAFMFSKLVWPVALSMEYIYAVPTTVADPWVLAAVVLGILLCVAVYRWRQSQPEQLFLLLFGTLLWLPTSNVFWHLSYFAADRYLYAPSAGLCVLAVLASERACVRRRRLFVSGWLAILVIFSALTWQQIGVWQNEMTLYSQMLKVSPRSLEAMIGLASAHYERKDYSAAADYARQAMDRDPSDARPYTILGNIAFMNSQFNDALELLLEAQKKNPRAPDTYNVLGSIYDDLGQPDRAVEAFRTALKLRPDYFQAYTNLGVVFERTGHIDEAETSLRKAIGANSGYVPAWFNLGIVLYRKHELQEARNSFAEAVRLNPLHEDAWTNLSVVCQELGDSTCYNDALRKIGSLPHKQTSGTQPH
jgi:Tfp pilus assembly protein PilF